jgi:hypothetical protein
MQDASQLQQQQKVNKFQLLVYIALLLTVKHTDRAGFDFARLYGQNSRPRVGP